MTEREAIEWFLMLKAKFIGTVYEKYLDYAISTLKKQEQFCETCKHGRFGDEACINCRVGFPNHYEAEEES